MDYSKAKIYKILNTVNDSCYIGSTCQPLSKRMAKHRITMKSENKNKNKLYQIMNELGVDNFYIELVKECTVENIEQLRAIEGTYIRQLGTLNMQVAGRSKKQWCEDNKDWIYERDKNYREENKDGIREMKKKWGNENKDRVKQNNQTYYNNNFGKIKEHHKEYYEKKKQ